MNRKKWWIFDTATPKSLFQVLVGVLLFVAITANADSPQLTLENNQGSSFQENGSESSLNLPLNRYLSSVQIGMGYTHTKWHTFDPSLRNGGLYVDLTIAKKLHPFFEGNVEIRWQSARPNASDQNGVGAYHIGLGGRGYFNSRNISPFLGISLVYGGYQVWTLQNEDTNSITYHKAGAGPLIGFHPVMGMRFSTSSTTTLDLIVSYVAYFDNPQYQVGGWSLGAGFTLLRY